MSQDSVYAGTDAAREQANLVAEVFTAIWDKRGGPVVLAAADGGDYPAELWDRLALAAERNAASLALPRAAMLVIPDPVALRLGQAGSGLTLTGAAAGGAVGRGRRVPGRPGARSRRSLGCVPSSLGGDDPAQAQPGGRAPRRHHRRRSRAGRRSRRPRPRVRPPAPIQVQAPDDYPGKCNEKISRFTCGEGGTWCSRS